MGEIRETLAFRDRGEAPCRHVAPEDAPEAAFCHIIEG